MEPNVPQLHGSPQSRKFFFPSEQMMGRQRRAQLPQPLLLARSRRESVRLYLRELFPGPCCRWCCGCLADVLGRRNHSPAVELQSEPSLTAPAAGSVSAVMEGSGRGQNKRLCSAPQRSGLKSGSSHICHFKLRLMCVEILKMWKRSFRAGN